MRPQQVNESTQPQRADEKLRRNEVPDIHELSKFGIGLGEVEDTLRWLGTVDAWHNGSPKIIGCYCMLLCVAIYCYVYNIYIYIYVLYIYIYICVCYSMLLIVTVYVTRYLLQSGVCGILHVDVFFGGQNNNPEIGFRTLAVGIMNY